MDDALTVPCEGIGVWEGARAILPTGEAFMVTVADNVGAGGPSKHSPGGGFLWSNKILALDLTHRPTRLEAMARLGARVGADVGEGVLWFRMFARRTWVVDGVAGASASWAPEEDGAASIVPALADLDPTDDTRLPDGARVVDVRALAIVLRDVFGGAR